MELESRQESRNRPKIKLVKNRGGARQKTDYDNYRGDNRATVREHLKNPAESYLSHNSKYD